MKRWTSKTFGAAGENCRLLLYSSLLSHFRKCIRVSSYPHIMSPSHSCVQDKVVYIVRHAQGQHNVSPSYDYDPPLTLEGHDQVWCLSASLPPCLHTSLPYLPTCLPASLPPCLQRRYWCIATTQTLTLTLTPNLTLTLTLTLTPNLSSILSLPLR
jgi:hypothetical protein